MKIHEYQAKQILARYNIPIPRGELAATPAEARSIAKSYGVPVVVKAQVLVGGRGKAGGVKLAATPDEAEVVAERILGMNIKGVTVRKVLVAEATDIAKEIYLGAVLDRTSQCVVVMASAEGGVEIEEVARTRPEKIVKVAADPFLGLADFQARQLAFGIGLPTNLVRDFVRIAKGLVQALMDTDASLAEINPLVIAKDGTLKAIDAKIVLDDNGLFRHRDLEALRDLDEEDIYEREARMNELSYVKLDGEIGCMVNGAGLAMATMDIIKYSGGMPANFLDVGGGVSEEAVTNAFKILVSDKDVKAALINIFGGIVRCDMIASGIVKAAKELGTKIPIVVRLEGTNVDLGKKILRESGLAFHSAESMKEAAERVVSLVK